MYLALVMTIATVGLCTSLPAYLFIIITHALNKGLYFSTVIIIIMTG